MRLRAAGGFQPSGHGYCAAGVVYAGAGAGDAGDDGGLQAVDRVGAEAQQAGALGVESGDRSCLLERFQAVVHTHPGNLR